MAIAQMLVRGGLLTLVLTSAVATAKAICRIMRSPSLSDAGLSERDPSKYAVDLRGSPSGSPVRRDPPSLVVRERAYCRAPVAAAFYGTFCCAKRHFYDTADLSYGRRVSRNSLAQRRR